MRFLSSALALTVVTLFSFSAMAECSILVDSRFRNEMRTLIRDELAASGVKALFADEVGVNDYETPYEGVPADVQIGETVIHLGMESAQGLPSIYLAELYTSAREGLYHITTITDFTFGITKVSSCKKSREWGGVVCAGKLAEKGLIFERVVSQSTRDLVVVGGELKEIQRTKASGEEVRSYLKNLAARVCK